MDKTSLLVAEKSVNKEETSESFARERRKRMMALPVLGACAMTTKFLNNKISTFKFLFSWRFLLKTAFLDDSPLCPHPTPPPQRKFYFYCRLTVSEIPWCTWLMDCRSDDNRRGPGGCARGHCNRKACATV